MPDHNQEVDRYPLSWPHGWKRTPYHARQRAPFSKRKTVYGSTVGSDGRRNSWTEKESLTVGDGLKRLDVELRRLGARNVIISSNLRLRGDGLPHAGQAKVLDDPGIAVYFRLNQAPRVLACDKWLSAAENMAAIAGHIEAIRAQERYGVGTLEQAFAGYAALPPAAVDWAIVLGVSKSASREEILAAHRRLAIEHHPDKGGRQEDMARINEARDLALEELARR